MRGGGGSLSCSSDLCLWFCVVAVSVWVQEGDGSLAIVPGTNRVLRRALEFWQGRPVAPALVPYHAWQPAV